MRLPKIETLIIVVFMLCVAVWMMGKCQSRRANVLQNITEDREDRPVRRDTVVLKPTAPTVVQQPLPTTTAPTPTPTPIPGPSAQSPVPSPAARTAVPPPTAAKPAANTTVTTATKSNYTMLFVTIDGLKVRKKPGLKSETIAKLDLYSQVAFLNERTEWTQELSLGVEKVSDHWVKIKTKDGKIGWVFGAGVNYFKEKRKGVLD